IVFILFSIIAFHMHLRWNHVLAAACLVAAVYFVFGFE
ncbi:MAG: DMT family protein, partial [Paludibacteraceae bacterium]|nr:DMT family protein [Paludibacteraceae bacterium]